MEITFQVIMGGLGTLAVALLLGLVRTAMRADKGVDSLLTFKDSVKEDLNAIRVSVKEMSVNLLKINDNTSQIAVLNAEMLNISRRVGDTESDLKLLGKEMIAVQRRARNGSAGE